MDKPNFGKNIEDLIDLTDEEDDSSSTSSNPYEMQQFILDLHEISKEDPSPEQPKRVKKVKKKKRNRSQASVSSDSTANTVSQGPVLKALTPGVTPTVVEELPKEEFYDAHESYHALPEKQRSVPAASVAPGAAVTPVAAVTAVSPVAAVPPLAGIPPVVGVPSVAAVTPVTPVVARALTLAISTHGQDLVSSSVIPEAVDPKLPVRALSQRIVLEAQKEPSVISKPVTKPE